MKTLRLVVLLLLAAGLTIMPAPAAADCPPDNPDCLLHPPPSIEVNPEPRTAEGKLVQVEEPGQLIPVQALVPMPAPPLVEVALLDDPGAPAFDTLPVRMRYQEEGDTSCGVQALGMALEGLGGAAPVSGTLLEFLQRNGMLYDFGTGVEELAYAAQAFGYKGSIAYPGGTLDLLRSELAAGRPVVVALGADPETGAGHFVTVTGISPDGEWVALNDPALGERVMPAADFLAQWAQQGSSGVRVALETPERPVDLMPWVAFFAGLAAVISQTPLVLKRRGIGGKVISESGGVTRPKEDQPPPPPEGYRWVLKEKPKYEWREVQEGWDIVPHREPLMVKKQVQVGWTTVYDKVPTYEAVMVQEGWTTEWVRVPEYKTERVLERWKRLPDGERIPIYGTRRVQVGWTYEKKSVPRMVPRQVLTRYRVVEQRVPKYEVQLVQDGWTVRDERVPHMVKKQVQVGTEVVWELERAPVDAADTRVADPGDYDYEIPLLLQRVENAREQASQPASPEPVLEPVPHFADDPLGWIRAKVINAGRTSDTVKNAVVGASHLWGEYVLPASTAGLQFINGFGYQLLKSNLEPISWIATLLVPGAREDIPQAVRQLEGSSVLDSNAARWGRIAGGLATLFESAFLIATGAGEAIGGAAVCGSGVLCWAGAGVVALGVAEVAGGVAAATVSIRDIAGQMVAIRSENAGGGKPLTPADVRQIDKIGKTERFLSDHPDLAEEARIVNNGGHLPEGRDHITEAEEWITGLERTIGHLRRMRPYRDPQAQGAIDAAIASAEEYIRLLEGLLRGN